MSHPGYSAGRLRVDIHAEFCLYAVYTIQCHAFSLLNCVNYLVGRFVYYLVKQNKQTETTCHQREGWGQVLPWTPLPTP